MFVLLIICLITVLYFYGNKNYNYWSSRSVKHNKPIPFFGNNFNGYMQRASKTEVATALYNQFPDQRFVGFYRGTTPELLIRDPDLIRRVLTTDFQHFHARGLGRDPDVEPMLKNMFHADGDVWKLLRKRLTPAFTSGKLKGMFPLILERAEELHRVSLEVCAGGVGGTCDVRELMARFTTDFIGACGFGIKMDSMNDKSSQFRKMGERIFQINFRVAWRILLKELFPKLCKYLKPFDQRVEDSIVDLVRTILEHRNYEPSGRNDFVDLMLELKSQGKMAIESMERVNEDGSPILVEQELDSMLMAAQCFIFFAAGFETSSSATSYMLHELAHNPRVQTEVHEEIDRVLAKYQGKLSYDAVKEMTFLECTFKEGLRKFPSLGVLNRICTKKYKIPETDVWIDEGVAIVIPVAAIQNDEQYFETPEEFNPHRFQKDCENNRHKFTYLPFGEGPRACIGSRLGLLQSLAGLAALLQRVTVSPAPGACRRLKLQHRFNIVQSVQGGIPLVLTRRCK